MLHIVFVIALLSRAFADDCELAVNDNTFFGDAQKLQCELTKQYYKCDKLGDTDSIIKCDSRSLQENSATKINIKGCVWTGLELTPQMLLDVATLVRDLPEKIVDSFKNQKACDRSMDDKRQLLTAFDLSIPDERFRLESGRIGPWLEKANCEEISQLLSNRYKNFIFEREGQNRAFVNRGRPRLQNDVLDSSDLSKILKEILDSIELGYNCYTPNTKAEFLCTALTTIITDAALGAGVTGIISKVEKLAPIKHGGSIKLSKYSAVESAKAAPLSILLIEARVLMLRDRLINGVISPAERKKLPPE
jgi:hypothetical protein